MPLPSGADAQAEACARPSAVLAAMPAGAGIALIRLRSLGDTLLTTPALAALKRWRPDLRLAVLVEPQFAALLDANPDLADIIPVPASLGGRLGALRRLRRFRPALAVGLHGGSTAAWLSCLSGAPHRATFLGLRHPWAYTLHTPPKPPPPGRERLHTVEHVASLLEALGMPETELGPARLFPSPAVRGRMRQRLAAAGVDGGFAFLNLEAREPGMRWPLERYRALAASLRQQHRLASVAASASTGTAVEGITLIPNTTVAELIALQAESALMIGNDGGPIHIAAALGKPVVALYASTDVAVWSPWRTRAQVLQNDVMEQITLDSVQQAVEAVLAASA